MADEYEPLGPAEGAPAPPPDAPPPVPAAPAFDPYTNPEGKELKSATGDTGTQTGQEKDGARSRASTLKLPKGIKNVPKDSKKKDDKVKSRKSGKEVKSKSDSKSGSGEASKSEKKNKNGRMIFIFLLASAVAFTISLILTFIIMGHAWFGFEFIEALVVYKGSDDEKTPAVTSTRPPM